MEVVRHYGLMEALGKRTVISSLARRTGSCGSCAWWPRDRSFLFASIAGSLSAFGMNIVEAEAFANGSALVLDTFRFADPGARFDRRRRAARLPAPARGNGGGPLRAAGAGGRRAARRAADVRFDDNAHRLFTRLGWKARTAPGFSTGWPASFPKRGAASSWRRSPRPPPACATSSTSARAGAGSGRKRGGAPRAAVDPLTGKAPRPSGRPAAPSPGCGLPAWPHKGRGRPGRGGPRGRSQDGARRSPPRG